MLREASPVAKKSHVICRGERHEGGMADIETGKVESGLEWTDRDASNTYLQFIGMGEETRGEVEAWSPTFSPSSPKTPPPLHPLFLSFFRPLDEAKDVFH